MVLRIPHYYTGLSFLVIGIRHMIILPMMYFRSYPYFSTRMFGRELPLESFAKAILCTVGVIWEQLDMPTTGGEERIKMITHMHYQHQTMFSVFAIAGMFEIADFYKIHFPKNFIYVVYSIAFGIEGIIFYWHYPIEKKPLITELHTFQVYIIAATFLVGLVEMKYREEPLPALCRVFLVNMQAFWFTVTDTITDPETWMRHWDYNDPFEMMNAAILFAATTVFCLFFCVSIWLILAYRMGALFTDTNTTTKKPIANGTSKATPAKTFDVEYTRLETGDSEHLVAG